MLKKLIINNIKTHSNLGVSYVQRLQPVPVITIYFKDFSFSL